MLTTQGANDKDDYKLAMTDSMMLSTPPPPVPVTAQRHMFTPDSRKALLREVVRLKPYKNPNMWDAVTHSYGWWCYKNICPPRRTVPKDRLRKKVKSIIAKYPHSVSHASAAAAQSATGAEGKPETSSPENTSATAAKIAIAVDDDNMPYDPETLGLIEEVVKQYTESVELIQSKRSDGRKRDSEAGLGPHSPGSSKSPPTLPAGLRFRPPMTPGADHLLHTDASSYSTPLGITDMLSRQKRAHDDDEEVLELNNIHPSKYRKGYSNGAEERSKGSSKFIDDILLNTAPEFDTIKGGDMGGPSSQVAYFAESVASAASAAIMTKLPELLDAVRDASEEANKARMESLGNSLGTAFASSFSASFEATVNKAIESIFRRLETATAGRGPADAGSGSSSKEDAGGA